jgi:acetyl esterase/lipase
MLAFLGSAWTTMVGVSGAEDLSIVKGLKFSEVDPSLTLDLYLPKASEDLVPCIIVIQGGGFLPQNGQRFKSFAEHLAKNDFAAALISYRGRPDVEYQDTLADVKASVRFVRKVAEEYQIDSARIGATGRSAGGTLAALLAVTGDVKDRESRIQAAVCFAGVFDFVSRFTKQEQLDLQPNRKTKMETNGKWIGAPFSATDKDWLAASAITHVDRNDPPVLFLHSRDDSTVPWIQSRDMHRAMENAGIAAELRVYETGGHGVMPKNENSLDDMVRFLRKYL